MLKQYLQDIFNTTKTGDAREESYYPDLKKMLESWCENKKRKCPITSLPKKTEAGNPDFRVWDGKNNIVGYIEAKAPGANLDVVESSEQLKRYRETFPNLILTDFFEFRLYRNGELVDNVKIGRPFIMRELKTIPPLEKEKEFFEFLEKFFSFTTPKTTTAKMLAVELANRTRFLRDQIIIKELEEEHGQSGQLYGFYRAFKEHLIDSLTPQDFANLYAQTITYGLFTARSRADKEFNRKLAFEYIPNTIGILKDVFRFISSQDLPQQLEWIVDEIAGVLNATDVKKIINNFYKEGKGKDPIIHFYETFLAAYDPKEREKRGVYYTPEPIVSYITRSVHKILKEKFEKEDGFATESVTVLDPASGTFTFPSEAIHLAVDEYKKKYGASGIKGLIKDHILKNFYAFELMMASYAIGHLKAGFLMEEFDYKLSAEERFKLYLTNTLEFKDLAQSAMPHLSSLSEESKLAGIVKRDVPVMAIIGNPPYSGVSENKSEWILREIKDYKQVDGKPLGERKDWLQDDYVKFFRFAQWKIEQNKQGVLGFITNHAWLDNITFRGMRASLLKTFDEIYIVNLHGSTIKKEKTPEGGKDGNVFDIRAGVAIAICVKTGKAKDKKVFYADKYGLREEKYEWLLKNDYKSTKWIKLNPKSPNYYFVPKEEKGRKGYEEFNKITDIFPVNSTGVLTARDNFVIDFNKQSLEARIRMFRESKDDDEFIKNSLGLHENYSWRVSVARQELKKVENWEDCFKKISYRPFDERWIYYHPAVVWRTRENVMQHMLRENLAIVTTRQQADMGFYHALVTDKITESCFVSNKTREIGYVYPLYLYKNNEKKQTSLLDNANKQNKNVEANLNSNFISALERAWNKKFVLKKKKDAFCAADVFNYIYAILYANIYRQKYQEFLKDDFPRIPFTKDFKLFETLARLGEKLVSLHLLNSSELQKPISKFQGEDSNLVSKREYDEKTKRVYVNNSQYFDNIKPELWNYHIGGYQALDKWLKDRKGRILSSEEVKHYCRIVTALSKTMETQKEIDKLYPKVEKMLIKRTLNNKKAG